MDDTRSAALPPDYRHTNRSAKTSVHQRRNLWELPVSSHCMVIGTCLTLADIKTVARKCNHTTGGKTDYQLHQFFVSQASLQDSLIAKQTQKTLNKKFRREISQLQSIDNEADLLSQWQTFNDTGNVAAGLWAVITHPSSNSTLLDVIFGEVHMLSHLSGASVHRQAAEVPAMRHEVKLLRNKLTAQKLTSAQKIKSYQYEVVRLENVNQQLNHQLADAVEKARDDSNQPGNPDRMSDPDLLSKEDSDRIKCLVKESNELLRSTRSQLHAARALADDQKKQLEEQKHDTAKLEQLISYLVQQQDQGDLQNEADDTGPAFAECDQSLSGKCVLLLGGMPSQCKHFRAFVESNNGDFLHHDGGVESSYSQIDQLVNRADAVFCPVEQVSHSAMSRAKKLCKKAETPLVFLPRSSLSAFVSGIRTIQ